MGVSAIQEAHELHITQEHFHQTVLKVEQPLHQVEHEALAVKNAMCLESWQPLCAPELSSLILQQRQCTQDCVTHTNACA